MTSTQRWRDVRDVIQQFDLKADPEDADAIRRELLVRLTAVHPDQFAPNPWPDDAKTQFLGLQGALNFVEAENSGEASTAMVPVSVITDLVAAIKDSRESDAAPRTSRKSVE